MFDGEHRYSLKTASADEREPAHWVESIVAERWARLPPARGAEMGEPQPDILLTHLIQGIGIALDFKGDRMFLTDSAGSIYSAKLGGAGKKPLLVAQGNLTSITYAEINTKAN